MPPSPTNEDGMDLTGTMRGSSGAGGNMKKQIAELLLLNDEHVSLEEARQPRGGVPLCPAVIYTNGAHR